MLRFDVMLIAVVAFVVLLATAVLVALFCMASQRRAPVTQDSSDDLDDSTATLLSMLHVASVVVNDSDEVVRASPSTYSLGVVDDDRIVNERIQQEIDAVRASGRRRRFELTTMTPERFRDAMHEPINDGGRVRDVKGVSRPNWLKVTVGRVNSSLVVVLLDDVSEAKRFAEVRDSFIVNVSQQLLKPTKALEELADSLERDGHGQEETRHDAARVRDSCRRMSHMVTDLLLLIKAQEPITPSSANRINIMEQLTAVASREAAAGESAGVALMVGGDDSLYVHGEKNQICSAVTKLIENALGYSPRGAAVSLSAAVSPDRKFVVIRVVDSGSGIEKNEQARIFERFYRGAHQNARTQEGIGLGLAIVKHVALTHHGSVSVWSSPGHGSTFSLMLPLAR